MTGPTSNKSNLSTTIPTKSTPTITPTAPRPNDTSATSASVTHATSAKGVTSAGGGPAHDPSATSTSIKARSASFKRSLGK